jgi:hypothetical protein
MITAATYGPQPDHRPPATARSAPPPDARPRSNPPGTKRNPPAQLAATGRPSPHRRGRRWPSRSERRYTSRLASPNYSPHDHRRRLRPAQHDHRHDLRLAQCTADRPRTPAAPPSATNRNPPAHPAPSAHRSTRHRIEVAGRWPSRSKTPLQVPLSLLRLRLARMITATSYGRRGAPSPTASAVHHHLRPAQCTTTYGQRSAPRTDRTAAHHCNPSRRH